MPAEHEAESLKYAQKLCDGLNLAIKNTDLSDPTLSQVLGCGEIYAGVEGLEMDVSVIAFPQMKNGDSQILSYTWDFLDEYGLNDVAKTIIESVREAQSEGTLPRTADDFQQQ